MPKGQDVADQAGIPAHYEAITSEAAIQLRADFVDDVLAKLVDAFAQVVTEERWTKRDLAKISGLNETGIGHILAGRRKNLTVETVSLLAAAMRRRPELVLHDTRPFNGRHRDAWTRYFSAVAREFEPDIHAFAKRHVFMCSQTAETYASVEVKIGIATTFVRNEKFSLDDTGSGSLSHTIEEGSVGYTHTVYL